MKSENSKLITMTIADDMLIYADNVIGYVNEVKWGLDE